ncbi:iron-containing alcohol dehydrogenase [Chloropicon roscoffensis]|uniref:Alcohol dehydrogenase 4 n=1 Tax=Chloropicon roscoffensis TaxID=1461544 RepID=A0AAX4PLV3_9CHLO|eukprot:CAMPEP_0198469010 /NCGR_PEP_ID=MMETSP1456-20131121/10855_1 /TAXON_ID=1461544 ORGANISM="Unidentified sp., Strain RCC1871" /NCGR_SAMPLE_ID=MMETSP1456 /ASSEMBLY_ACC=CAM_ASM_001119 /LENGTH=482 /DNA_ID=CAMNT_0044195341 /DNA_START=45 /DNA_END=1493 /DNA_ORIENTATION=-
MRASAYRFSGRGRRLAARCSATEPASAGTGGDEKKVRSKIPKAPARSVRAHLQGVPLDHIVKVPKAGVGLASDGTQTAHGLNYHHAQNAGGEGYYFYMPTVSLMGPGALKKAVRDMGGRGLGKVLVVTDRVLREIGALSSLTDLLDEHGIAYEVFDEITPNPTSAQVMAGVEAVERLGCEGVVSFGGGSPHDCAKGIALVCANGGHIKDYEGENKSAKKMLPMVAVNTTAGTASEMTRFCIVTDEERHVKMAIVDWHVTPDVAVDDPELMVGMPPGLTAATGMDALTHAIEAYVSTASTPITDACALHAIKLISRYLRTAVRDGEDLRARDMMSYAEFLAGMAFNSASLGYVHAMAHQLGGFYDLPHGVCNAVLLPVVQLKNAEHVPDLFLDLAEAMGIEGLGEAGGLGVAERAREIVIRAIRQLSRDVGIPENLEALGVRREDFEVLAENAMKDACGMTNPFQPTKEEVVEMFEEAYAQKH